MILCDIWHIVSCQIVRIICDWKEIALIDRKKLICRKFWRNIQPWQWNKKTYDKIGSRISEHSVQVLSLIQIQRLRCEIISSNLTKSHWLISGFKGFFFFSKVGISLFKKETRSLLTIANVNNLPRTRFVPWNIPSCRIYTQKNLFEILLNQPEIRLYLPFSGWFGTQTDPFV